MIFAATKLSAIPPTFWYALVGIVGGIILLKFLVVRFRQGNKMLMGIVGLVIALTVGLNWIYERTEPKFLSPVVSFLAKFLPSKGTYTDTQRK